MLHNISTVSYLVAQFKQLIEKFGERPEQIEYFREQVGNLVELSKVSQADAEFVYKLVGMQNTSNVKWQITRDRLNKFINAMNYIVCYEDDYSRANTLRLLQQTNGLDDKTVSLIDELYDNKLLDKIKEYDNSKQGKFGTFGTFQGIKNSHSQRGTKQNQNNLNNLVDQAKTKQLKTQTQANNIGTGKSGEDVLRNRLLWIRAETLVDDNKAIEYVLDAIQSCGYNNIHDLLQQTIQSLKDSPSIKVKNYEAQCQCDPSYYILDLREILQLNLSYPDIYGKQLIKSIDKNTYFIVEKYKSERVIVKEFTEKWQAVNQKDLLEVFRAIIAANKRIKETSKTNN